MKRHKQFAEVITGYADASVFDTELKEIVAAFTLPDGNTTTLVVKLDSV